MALNTRQDLVNYCFRALGAPVVEINVDMDQVECYRALDPSTATKIYNDRWLKHYTTALLNQQTKRQRNK